MGKETIPRGQDLGGRSSARHVDQNCGHCNTSEELHHKAESLYHMWSCQLTLSLCCKACMQQLTDHGTAKPDHYRMKLEVCGLA